MTRSRVQILTMLLIAMLMFSACNNNGGNEDIQLPTRVDSASDSSDDSVQQSENVDVGVTSTAVANTPEGRPTLPPSWTPTVSPTSTITLTPPPTLDNRATPVACGDFRVDRDRTTFEFSLGQSPTFAWTIVPGAEFYRIRIFNEAEAEITLDPLSSTETSITVNPDVFTSTGRFGWLAEPIGTDGVQMCTGMGEGFIIN